MRRSDDVIILISKGNDRRRRESLQKLHLSAISTIGLSPFQPTLLSRASEKVDFIAIWRSSSLSHYFAIFSPSFVRSIKTWHGSRLGGVFKILRCYKITHSIFLPRSVKINWPDLAKTKIITKINLVKFWCFANY